MKNGHKTFIAYDGKHRCSFDASKHTKTDIPLLNDISVLIVSEASFTMSA